VVSPEIRANTALRICLRVTSAAESTDVVDTTAAAAISPTTPGRAILRTGSIVREFQTALVSGTPHDDAPQVVTLGEWRELPPPAHAARESDLQRLVTAARSAHEASSPPHRPWLEPLPSRLPITMLDATDEVVIGRVDLPADQRQPPLTIDVANGTTVLISGRPRSGRSTALHTIAHAAAKRYPPAELHIYGIDAAGTGLAALRALPHVGTIATVVDGFDFAARLVDRLLTSTRRSLILIDGLDELFAASDDHDGGRTADRVSALLRAAGQRQSTVVVAGGRAALAPRLTALAARTYLLAQNDAAEYTAAGVPTHAAPRNPPPGRGVRSGDWAQMQFAVADEPAVVDRAPARDAIRMRPLPDSIRLAQVASPVGVVLGVCGDDCTPVAVDLVATDSRVLVAGPPRSGCSTVLLTVLEQSAQSAVVASARSPLLPAAREMNHPVVSTADDLPGTGVLLVDDVHLVTDTALGDAIAAWVDAGVTGRAVVAAGRADVVALGYRGLIGRLRAQSCGILLRPRASDATILGIELTRTRTVLPAGRGFLVPDPRWGLGAEPVAIQVAVP
jgi:S-DNA-T family DNA segregation ATPase FtsK/SpoIIIE